MVCGKGQYDMYKYKTSACKAMAPHDSRTENALLPDLRRGVYCRVAKLLSASRQLAWAMIQYHLV